MDIDPKYLKAVSALKERIGPAPENVKIILVVCSGNICRSPMAEAYLISRLHERNLPDIKVYSAGTLNITGEPADPKAVAVGMDAGLDLRKHSSYGIDQLPVGYADIILTMEELHSDYVIDAFPVAKGKTFLLGEFSPRDPGVIVPDPVGGTLEDFHRAFGMIKEYTDLFVEWLRSGKRD